MGYAADHAVKVSMIFSSVAAVFVVARLCTRIFLIRRPGVDDYLMTVAVMFSFLFSSMIELRE
jgi:hypothetical protein